MASGLFLALRVKHAPTATHCLRVALACSSWSLRLGLDSSLRDELEVAALLHDIGKIGVPDSLLGKPELLRIVWYAPAWFDGRRPEFDCKGSDLPFYGFFQTNCGKLAESVTRRWLHDLMRQPGGKQVAAFDLHVGQAPERRMGRVATRSTWWIISPRCNHLNRAAPRAPFHSSLRDGFGRSSPPTVG